MLEVIVSNKDGQLTPLTYDTKAVQIIDGSLIVMDASSQYMVAGYAPGRWSAFHIVEGGWSED